MDVMKELGQPQITTESLVVNEFAFLLARLLTMGMIILGYMLNSFLMFKILTVTLVGASIASYILFRIWWHYYKDMVPRVPYTPKQHKPKHV